MGSKNSYSLIEALEAGIFSDDPPSIDEVDFDSTEVLRLRAGDMLVYTHPSWLTETQYNIVRDQLLDIVPDGVNLAILDGGARFQIIRKENDNGDINS